MFGDHYLIWIDFGLRHCIVIVHPCDELINKSDVLSFQMYIFLRNLISEWFVDADHVK